MMNKLVKISIIMPAYNAEEYIKESIDSIIAQTYTNWELIIADDSSTDNTKQIINSYRDSRIKCIYNDNNLGYLKTCNRLFSLCKGGYITFQDADDISYPNRLSEQVKAFEQDTKLGMVGTFSDIISTNGEILETAKRPISYEEVNEKIIESNAFIGATVMIKREVYEKIGGYREYFNRLAYQDYDWTYLIVEKYKSINLSHPLYQYRQHPTSTSKIVDPKRIVSDKLVKFLAKQRKDNGVDCLQQNNPEILDKYFNKLLTPYKKDLSLIYREFAAGAMYSNMKKRAIDLSWQAIKKEPFKLINWRTIFYCMRK